MICQSCKKNIATSLVSHQSITGQMYTIALCDECNNRIRNQNHTQLQCSRCGAALTELTSGKLQFCPECYTSFGEELSDYLIKIHGSAIHTGKRPKRYTNNTESVKENKDLSFNEVFENLKRDLDTAIREERYEDAAQIRDEIKRLKEVCNNGK